MMKVSDISSVSEHIESSINNQEALLFVSALAKSAGNLVMKIREGKMLDTTSKSNEESDIVTAADHASERLIADALRTKFPTHSIRGEEGTKTLRNSEYEWIIDPIDGTLNFSKHKPFGISIGLLHKNTPILGVIYFPDDGTLLSAAKGEGTFLNDQRINKKNKEITLQNAHIGFDVSSGGNAENESRRFEKPLQEKAHATERIYCSTYAARRIIEGSLDAYVCGGGLTPFDLGAATVILTEAGFSIRGLNGSIDFSAKKIPFLVSFDTKIESEILDTLSPAINGKHAFYSALSRKYPDEIRLLLRGGHLRKKDGWRNVVEHCMVQTSAAEVLCELLKLAPKESEAICSTSAIHDWKKRWERTGENEPDTATKLLHDAHPHEELLQASNPDYLEEVYLGRKELDLMQKIQFYLDIITRENDIVRSEDRIREVETAPRSKGLAEKAAGNYWTKTRELRDAIETELFARLKNACPTLGSPADIPILIAEAIEKKWTSATDNTP